MVDYDGGIFEKSISVEAGLNPLLEFLESVLSGSFYEGMGIDTNTDLMSDSLFDSIISFIGVIFGAKSFFGTMDALSLGNAYTNLSGITAAVGSFVASIIFLIFAPVAIAEDAMGNSENENL
ncbi:MAG: hypothetical protein ACLFVB_07885 [Thermoplasmata archaeon]